MTLKRPEPCSDKHRKFVGVAQSTYDSDRQLPGSYRPLSVSLSVARPETLCRDSARGGSSSGVSARGEMARLELKSSDLPHSCREGVVVAAGGSVGESLDEVDSSGKTLLARLTMPIIFLMAVPESGCYGGGGGRPASLVERRHCSLTKPLIAERSLPASLPSNRVNMLDVIFRPYSLHHLGRLRAWKCQQLTASHTSQ
ncbi:SEC14 domain and spectrin repeat-containing protein 1, partial [Lates japonicus]